MVEANKRNEVQRLLDGELSGTECAELLRSMSADPLLKQDYESLAETILAVEEAEHPVVPPFFTAEVMRRLRARPAPLPSRAFRFLLRPRIFRWNIAYLAALLSAAFFVYLFLSGPGLLPTAAPGLDGANKIMVTFRLHAPDARSVALSGEFNRWMVNDIFLSRVDGGVWQAEISLPPGTYAYMFVIDGRTWLPDPDADAFRDDGFGSRNSLRRVYRL